MEAGPNTENTTQEIKNQDIKVEDFFVNDQNNIVNENIEEPKDTNENPHLNEDNIKVENENLKIEEKQSEELKQENEDLFNNPEVKYSKIPEFDEDNRKTRSTRRNNNNGNTKSKNKKIILDEEEKKYNTEENKDQENENNDNIDDIELLLDENDNKKSNGKKIANKRQKKEKVKTDVIFNSEEKYNLVVDLEEIKKKSKIENADIILCLIEICTNSNKYGLTSSNKSRLFWDELFKKEDIAIVFNNFKSETLRKYWRLINELNKTEKVIETVKKYEEQINKENVKLLTIINAICDSIKGKHKSLENYFATVATTGAKKSTSNGKKNLTKKKRKRDSADDESSDSLMNDLIVINKNIEKSKKQEHGEQSEEGSFAENLEENIEEPENEEYDEEDYLESDDEPFQIKEIDISREKKNKRRLTRTQIAGINKVIKPTEKEKKMFDKLDEILEAFAGNFTNVTTEQILDVFAKNSFDYYSAYLQLVNPGIFERKCFETAEDFIIKNLKETDYYEELLDRKGEDAIKLRHKFLKIEEEEDY